MSLRDDSMKKFGPKLAEAVVLLILEEINILRVNLSLSERTTGQLLTQLNNRIESLPDYDWMDNV